MSRMITDEHGKRFFIRFNLQDRLEHLLIMVLFAILVLTGLPQKFSNANLSGSIISFFGGIENIRIVHRFSGILIALQMVFHLSFRSYIFLKKRETPSMFIHKKDFQDAILNLRYYLGFTEEHAQSDRFDYKQKFEYWGLIFGSVIMVLSGFFLYFPVFFTAFLPGQVIPAAKVAHSNEAMLALLVVVVWHMYDCIFSPEVFPLDKSMFNGKISEERMKKEHPLEYQRETEK